MASSSRFGSMTSNYSPYSDSVSLRLHLQRLNLARYHNSLNHNAKGTSSGFTITLWLFVSVWFQVLFHSPYRGSFHLSLTVLVHYRSVSSILPWRVGPPASDKVSRASSYSGYLSTHNNFEYETFTLFGWPSQTILLSLLCLNEVLQPRKACFSVWALPISIASTAGISFDYSSFGY